MPAYAPNYTARYRLRYHAAGANHVQTWRIPGVGDATALADIVSLLNDYYDALNTVMFDDLAVISASYALRDSDIFLPTTGPTIAPGTIPFAGATLDVKAIQISWTGRGLDGNPWRMFQYGTIYGPTGFASTQDFRVSAGEDPSIDAALAFLSGAAGTFVNNNEEAVAVNQYANCKYNDYWTGKVRNG